MQAIDAHIYEDGQGGELPYRLILPEEADGPRPLLIFLHGAGERGDDNERQLIWGKALMLQAAQEFGAVVLAPQCPKEQKWTVEDWAEPGVTFAGEPSDPMRLTQALIDELIAKHNIDSDRLYLVGLSMGGYGTWEAVSRWPKRFAAAAPICGGADTGYADQLTDLPLWVFHGENDPVVQVQYSRDIVQAIRDAGGDPKYTEYPGVGHNSWTPAFAEPELLPWLMSHSRAVSDPHAE